MSASNYPPGTGPSDMRAPWNAPDPEDDPDMIWDEDSEEYVEYEHHATCAVNFSISGRAHCDCR